MPEKGKRRTAAAAPRGNAVNETAFADGVIGQMVDRVFDNPAMSGGLFVMALTATAIVSNAMFLQTVRHPEPLFATRPPLVVERSAPAAVPLPPHREDQTGSVAPPLPRPAPLPPKAAQSQDTLVRDVQTALAKKGLYLGAIDGMFGALSRSAIVSYETSADLPVTGEPSAALLEHMKTAHAAPPPALPPAVVAAIPPDAPAAAQAAPATQTATVAPSAGEVRAEIERIRYQRIQTALNRIGYGPVVVDGTPDEETASAIRRFELDNGLPISGVAGEEVIERLVAIGAMPAA